MSLTKPRRSPSDDARYNHLDALGGIELKAFVKRDGVDGVAARAVQQGEVAAVAVTPSQPPSG